MYSSKTEIMKAMRAQPNAVQAIPLSLKPARGSSPRMKQ